MKTALRMLGIGVAGLVALVGLTGAAQATIIVSHVGNNDPTGETPAWTQDNSGATFSSGTDTKPYWEINSPARVNPTYGEYYYLPGPSDVSGDWYFKAVVEAPTLSISADDVKLMIFAGTKYYQVGLRTNGLEDLNAVSMLSVFTPNPAQYYSLELQKSVSTGLVTAYLDGVNEGVVSGNPYVSSPKIIFGDDGAGYDATVSRWNYVAFGTGLDPALVPEPTTVSLFALGFGLCWWRRRR